MAKRIRLALDWTPNTIHTGFYVAVHKGYYDDLGLEVDFISPETDNYGLSPAKKVAKGLADVAIAPSESTISFQTKENSVPLIAIATILAKDASGIATLRKSGIEHPAQLDGKVYASYKARFEDQIIRQLIKNDGGQGDIRTIYPERLGIWNTLLNQKADATWIFLPWEGVEARLKEVPLNIFQLGDYNIPYGYSPVLLTHPSLLAKKRLRKFLKATAKGYHFAKNNPLEAADILIKTAQHSSLHDQALVAQSQVFIAQYYLDDKGNWGIMQNKVWVEFVDWLIQNNILRNCNGEPIEKLDVYELFTNDLLEN